MLWLFLSHVSFFSYKRQCMPSPKPWELSQKNFSIPNILHHWEKLCSSLKPLRAPICFIPDLAFRTVGSHYTDSECWQKVRAAWVRPRMWELAPFLSCWYLSGYLQHIQNCPNLNAVWPRLAARGSTLLRTHCPAGGALCVTTKNEWKDAWAKRILRQLRAELDFNNTLHNRAINGYKKKKADTELYK